MSAKKDKKTSWGRVGGRKRERERGTKAHAASTGKDSSIKWRLSRDLNREGIDRGSSCVPGRGNSKSEPPWGGWGPTWKLISQKHSNGGWVVDDEIREESRGSDDAQFIDHGKESGWFLLKSVSRVLIWLWPTSIPFDYWVGSTSKRQERCRKTS